MRDLYSSTKTVLNLYIYIFLFSFLLVVDILFQMISLLYLNPFRLWIDFSFFLFNDSLGILLMNIKRTIVRIRRHIYIFCWSNSNYEVV